MNNLRFRKPLDKLDERHFRAQGKRFGYPKCCINFFINLAKARLYAGLVCKSIEGYYTPKPGYLPCPECSEALKKKAP